MPHDSKSSRPDYQSFVGRVFGRLTVLSCLDEKPRAHSKWLCRCDCGKESTPRRDHLIEGRVRSCGCLISEIATRNGRASIKHGMSNTKEYQAWRSMCRRCHYVKDAAYAHYSSRGIVVCVRWRFSFDAFFADMGPAPEGTTLDRIDNNKGYEPGNCRWATPKVQARNRSTNRLIEYRGESLSVTEWAERTGIPETVIRARLRYKWAAEDILTKPSCSWVRRGVVND